MNEQSGCAGYVSVTLCVHAPLCHVSILFSVHSGCDIQDAVSGGKGP